MYFYPKFSGLALVTNATFSKAVVNILEVIGSFVMPPLLFLQLVLLSKVIKVSQIVHKGYSAQTSIRYSKEHIQDTFIAKQLWGTTAKLVTPIQSMCAYDWLIVTFDPSTSAVLHFASMDTCRSWQIKPSNECGPYKSYLLMSLMSYLLP